MKDSFFIRAMAEQDLPAVHPLLRQLGYEMDVGEVAHRYATVAKAPDHIVLVAETEGNVRAFLHAFIRPALEKPPEVIVQSLVVDEACRKNGVGKKLMAAAERWAVERGLPSVALSSNTRRQEAHVFYEKLGYTRYAMSHSFRRAAS